MEKLTIKPWQVMQAFENGADIEMSLIGSPKWSNSIDVLWNWYMRNYRISNITADGMRLDELIKNHYAKDNCNLIDVLKSNECNHLFAATSNSYGGLLLFLIEHPECISQVKVKQEKKLRPLTMEEFEKHKDEWFVTDGTKERIKPCAYDEIGVVFGRNISLKYLEIVEHLSFEDGSPCGVLE